MHDTTILENQPTAWLPTPEVIERSRVTQFMRQVGVLTWDELYQYSISDVEKFTEEVLKFLDIKFDPPYAKLLDTTNGPEFPNWFVRSADIPIGTPSHAGLNITEMCLDRWQTDEMKDQPAVIWEGESGKTETYTYSQLHNFVDRCASGLLQTGFQKGDAIGIHLPMIAETVVALLAVNRIGAIAVPVFSGYGVDAIASRMNAVKAKGLITCDGFYRRGKFFDALEIAEKAMVLCPTVERVFVTSCAEDSSPIRTSDSRYRGFNDLFAVSEPDASSAKAKTLAEDPLIILYTSGTTGKPKGILHTHASFPIKAAQDMAFGTDVGPGTRICWYTDIGWMMGPWLIYGALINGATICLYDGAPDYPTADRMWKFCEMHKVEVLGISPTLVRSLAAGDRNDENALAGTPVSGGVPPYKRFDLSALRIFASTGEPWNPAPWWWLFEKVGNSKLPIINYSGGTEIAGGILMGSPILPQKPCSFPAPCPGMDVDILNEEGKPVGPNEVGELVIRRPWIGMARSFWQEDERYLDTYWRRFKGIWVHGDWAMRDADGHWFILGRSDDTLKVAGKRVGPAEIEGLLASHLSVIEAAVIGVPDDTKGTAMIAFCVLTDDGTASADLKTELKSLVSRNMGKPLSPSQIYFVSDLPKTRNAKVMRRVVRAAFLGEDAGDLSALENPQSIAEIRVKGA